MRYPPRLLPTGLLIAASLSFFLVPATANQCIVGCHGIHANKAYKEGHTYTYDFEGSSTTLVNEAEGKSTVKLNAVVELAVKPDCIHQLKLKNVRVNDAPVSQGDVEKHALQFNYHDGQIDTSVCTEPGDSQASLNIKRAIASLFQSAVVQNDGATTHRETDVFGSCQTDFSFKKDGEKLTIHKEKNLAGCSHRESMRHALIHAVYDDASTIKSSPILDSHQKVELVLKNGVVDHVKSSETYHYRPFANGDAGAKTQVVSSLKFQSEKAGEGAAPVSLPNSLIFDAPHPVTDASSVESIASALKSVKDASTPDAAGEGAAEKFGDLIKTLRRSTKKDIMALYNQMKSSVDKKILLDGLMRTGSGEAAEVAVELIKSGEISKLQTLAFYASLALVNHVNLPSVTAVASLLDQPDLPRIGYLGVGRVIGKFCEEHSCEKAAPVKAALAKIAGKIGKGKANTRAEENVMIAAMKALYNAHYLDDTTMEKLVAIAKDKSVYDRVRVAAIEALPARCSMTWKKPLMEVLKDKEEDSEIRIKAYLSLAACACPGVTKAVKETLEVETVNQVGSFITSHLRNLRASTDPNKQIMKLHLGSIMPRNKFPEDFRKYSFNRELSYNIGAFGMGSSIEQNVIFSQKSFMPRSASLNLTTEVFGRSFNFLQVDARAENLDRLIEHYFGPKGVLQRRAMASLLVDGQQSASETYEYLKERLEKTRGRRSVKQADLDRFAKGAKVQEAEVDEDLDIDVSVRLFGVELVYMDFKESDASVNSKFVIDRVFDMIDRAFKSVKDFNHRGSNHVNFLDMDLVYPTGLGFPLTVGVEGNAVTHVSIDGKVDVPAILRDPSSAVMKIGFEPSASVAVVATLMIETFGDRSGLKIVSRMHTATGANLAVKVLDGRGIDLTFGMPKKKQEIISVSSQVLFVNKNQAQEAKFPKGREHSDCFDQFSTILGVTVCGHFSYPFDSIESVSKTPMFPLSGPSRFAISVENNDAASYHFRAQYDLTKIPEEASLDVSFDTPNSRTNRKVALHVSAANKPEEKFVKATLESPIKKISGAVVLENNDKKKALTVSMNHDSDEYYAAIGLMANGNKYKPILEYKIPDHIDKLRDGKGSSGGKPVYKVDGDITVSDFEDGKKYVFDKVSLSSSGQKLFGIDGFVTAKPGALAIDGKISHNEENLSVKLDASRKPHAFDLNLAVIPSKDPNIGFKTVWHYDMSSGLIDNSFIFIHGADLESTVNRLTITDRITYQRSENPPYVASGKTKTEITYPPQGVAMKLEIERKPDSFESELDVKCGKFKAGGEIEIKVEENPQNWNFGVEGYVMDGKIAVEMKHKKLSDFKRKFEGKLEIPGGKYEVETTTNYQVEANMADVSFNGIAKFNGKSLKLDYSCAANPQKVNSHAVMGFENVKYVDFMLKVVRGNSPHGNLNLILKNVLVVSGDFNFANHKGAANFAAELPKLGRKMKGTADVAITGSRHVANVEILFNPEKDPSKRIKIATDTDVTKTNVDSKNTIEIFSYKIEANTKGELKERPHGGWNFAGDMDVTLPNGRVFVAKAKQQMDRTAEKTDLSGQYEFSDFKTKGGESRKLAYEHEGGVVEPRRTEFHGKHQLHFVNFDGKDVKLNFGSRHEVAKGENAKKTSKLELGAAGSYLPKPFDLDFVADYTSKNTALPYEASWKLASSLGADCSIKGSGKYFDGHAVQKAQTCEVNVGLILPSEKLRNVQYEGSASAVVPDTADGQFDYSCSHKLTYNDDKSIKVNGQLRQTGFEADKRKEGSGKVTLEILAHPPLTIATSFNHDPTAEVKKGAATLNVNYGDKEVTAQVDASYLLDLTDIAVNMKATTPVEKFKNVEFGVVHKREKGGPWKYEVLFVADKNKYELKSDFEINPTVHRVNVVFICPAGKTELLAKVNKLGEAEYKGEWKVDSPIGFAVADGHVKMDNVDNFIIEVNFDSDKFQYRKVHAEITTSPAAKTGKRVILTVTSDGKNIITGSTNYNKRDEAGKVIVEGNGSLKIGENTRSSKFTYSRKQLTRENDGENGVAILLNANFGPSAVVGELKLSEKEVLVFNSYCEQSKDCAFFKLQSTVVTDQKTLLDHQIAVQVDLKKFNVPVEFGLKTTNKYHRKDFTFDHTTNLYLHTSKDKTQYSTQIYTHPKESAVILTLPSRELAMIAAVDVPKSKTPMGPYKIDISVYLDRKNRPNEKTSFVATGDINVEKDAGAIAGEARLIYPSQTKDMVVKGKLHYGGEYLLDANVDIDVFAKKTQKIMLLTRLKKTAIAKGFNITSVFEVNSAGQQLKVNLQKHLAISAGEIGFGSSLSYLDKQQQPKIIGTLFSLTPRHMHVLIQAPDRDVFKSDTAIDVSKTAQKINTEFVLLGNPPVILSFEAQDFNSFKYQSYQKNKPDTKLAINGRAVFGQVVEMHADHFKDGQKNNLFSVGFYLDESRFLKPNFAYSKENMAALLDFYRGLMTKRAEQMRQFGTQLSEHAAEEFKDLFDHLKKAQPNLKQAMEYYQSELDKLKQELNADTTIKEIHAKLNKVFGGLIEVIAQTLKQLTERLSELSGQFNEIMAKAENAVKAVVPRVKESVEKILHAAEEVFDAATKLAAVYIKAVLDIINEHQKDIKEIVTAVSGLVHDLVEIIHKGLNQIQKEVDSAVKLTVQQVQALPIYEFLKEKYAQLCEYQVPDTVLVPLEEAFAQLKRILPTEELREFFAVTYNYILKHLKRQNVDDASEIKNIYSHAIDALQSIVRFLHSRGAIDQLYGLFGMKVHADFGYWKNLPGVPILKLSAVNILRNGELPTIADLYYAYRPTLYASDIIPPFSKVGLVIEGGHFFSFDGRHLTMAGTCDYVLAQDMRDANFSVVGTFNNGKLVSVTVTAPGERITLKSNGNILVDNKPAEYPASTKNLHAFLTLPIVNVKSDYGVHVACSQKAPMICSVRVSGFYHGRLLGIFGNANNEPYDDFTLPSGHITEKEAEFGNAFRLNAACPVAPAVDHHNHQRNPTCTDYFSASSSLSPCFNYVNPANYRLACDHAMAAHTPRGACLITAAYFAACRKERIFVSIPAACASCKSGKDEIAIGDSFSVKIPKKEADIIFVVEQDMKNKNIFKDLIMPLISEVKTELSHHGITDVRVSLIGYGEHMKWPQHYTTGGSLNIDGDVKNMDFAAGTPTITLQEAKEGDAKHRLKYAQQRLNVELGTFKLTDAYEEAIRYPFRAGAAKAVVGVIANPCEKSLLPLSLQHIRLFLGQKVYHDLGLTYYHVGYLNDILVGGKPQKNVVGYDAKAGYTFSDSKKKPLEGSIDKNNIVLTSNDVCAAFAVSSGGAAFSSNHFLESKPNQKKFVQVTARRLADGLANKEIHEDCVCKQQFGLDGQANCKIVGRKDNEPSAKHTRGVKA